MKRKLLLPLLLLLSCAKEQFPIYEVQILDQLVELPIALGKCNETKIKEYDLKICAQQSESPNEKISVTVSKNGVNYGTGHVLTHRNHRASFRYIYGDDSLTVYILPRL